MTQEPQFPPSAGAPWLPGAPEKARCPHCLTAFLGVRQVQQIHTLGNDRWVVEWMICPSCDKFSLMLVRKQPFPPAGAVGGVVAALGAATTQ